MIIKYKFFKNTEDFEAFQDEESVKVFSIVPMVNAINMGATSANDGTNLQAAYGVLVTYSEKD